LLPATILLAGLLIFPLASGLFMSLDRTSLSGHTTWVGFGNLILLFSESRFLNDILNSLLYVAGNVVLSVPLAFAAALLITREEQARFFRPIYLLPWIIAPIVSTLLFRSMVDPTIGPIARFLEWISGQREVVILSNPHWALLYLIVHSFWRSFPFVMLFLSAGLASIPNEYYEVATVNGAGAWSRFIHVTLPLTSNQLGLSLLMISIWTLQDAETIYAFTQGGPGYSTETLAVRLFKMSFVNFNLNMGAAIGDILIMVSVILMLLYLRASIGEGIQS
jgi:multiple sugar transport system permease protein